MRSDVEIPLLQISVYAGINGRRDEWLYISGQDNLLSWGRGLRPHHCHRGHGHLRGHRTQPLLSLDAGANAKEQKAGGRCQNHERNQPTPSRVEPFPWGWRWMRHRRIKLILDFGFRHTYLPSSPRSRFSSTGLVFRIQPCNTLKNVGTKNRVETVAKSSPPMTARPSGAFCSPPSPSPSAIGTMPMIMASAVINTGRKRVNPASSAAPRESIPSAIFSVAKLTTRMLFEVATPMHMMAPISAGTLRVVCVINNIQAIPASAAGNAEIMMKGSSQD